MARAIDWASHRKDGNCFETLNIGRKDWNFQVKELAFAVKDIIGEIDVEINYNAEVDKRSYKVDFEKFATMAPDYQPVFDLENTINDLVKGMKSIQFQNPNFRNSQLIRLNTINMLIENRIIDNNLNII
jgi:nucleoside-diphosphate-sugar epimerase